MKKKGIAMILIVSLLIVLLTGAFTLVIYQLLQDNSEQELSKKPAYDYETFANYTTVQLFESIPVLYKEGYKIDDAYEYGQGYYTINVSGTTKADYEEYLQLLQEKGFKKHSDNGAEGMEGYVYTAAFTKEKLTLSVYYIDKFEATHITVSQNTNLSEHLIYQDSYLDEVQPGAKTTLHMIELNDNGNSFVIQLKNGHFIVEDGGNESDAPYLLDYLENLAPAGTKPVIEAWFITHAHSDHIGALQRIMNNVEYSSRIYVDGFYFVDPSQSVQQTVFSTANQGANVWFSLNAAKAFTREDGSMTKLYRPTLGQRYYFCDISIDIALTIDQIVEEAYYSSDFNDTSTWLMHNIEGQKFLHAGDAGETTTKIAMDFYDKEYFKLDMFAVLHHGINVYNYFTDYCTVKTLLYTNRTVGSLYTATWAARVEENRYLQETVQESLSHGTGTVVLEFPYTVGSSKTMSPCDWRYTDGKRKGKTWDVINGR